MHFTFLSHYSSDSICFFVFFFFHFADSSPIHTSAANSHSLWHGNIETSTDTLVPVIETTNQPTDDKLCLELTTAALADTENGIDNNSISCDRSQIILPNRTRNLPEVHSNLKQKIQQNGGLVVNNAMNESILMQPEHRKMDISCGNGNRYQDLAQLNTVTNLNGNLPLNRRRHNSFNSKASSTNTDMTNNSNSRPSDRSISPNTINSKFLLNNTNRSLPINQTTLSRSNNIPSTNISMISCPDGLAHALSEQNLRLQQIVYEHKVKLNEI